MDNYRTLLKGVSSRSLSEFGDEFDNLEQLHMHQYYETNEPIQLAGMVANAELEANKAIEKIIDGAVSILYGKYLDEKLGHHTIAGSVNLMELLVTTELVQQDENKIDFTGEEEPASADMDTWGRFQINQKEQIGSKVLSDEARPDTNEVFYADARKIWQKAKADAKKFIKDANQDHYPVPIDLNEPNDMNKTEDDLRMFKENQQRTKEKELQQEKQLKEQEMRERNTSNKADLKKKAFTYDFDCTRIMVNQAKVEKFPPSAYLVNYAIQNPEGQQLQTRKQNVKEVKTKLKKTPEVEKDYVTKLKDSTQSPQVYDMIVPERGVIFKEGGRSKKGNLKAGNATWNNGTLLADDGGPLRLTKSEYNQIIKGGNLSRTMTEKTSQSDRRDENWSIKVDIKEVDSEKNIHLKKMNDNKRKKKGIKTINASAIEELIKINNEDKTQTMPAAFFAANNTQQTGSIDLSPKKSPIDAFNIELMNSKDWGRGVMGGMTQPLPLLPRNKQMAKLKGVLGPMVKMPRERVLNPTMSKSGTTPNLAHSLKGSFHL